MNFKDFLPGGNQRSNDDEDDAPSTWKAFSRKSGNSSDPLKEFERELESVYDDTEGRSNADIQNLMRGLNKEFGNRLTHACQTFNIEQIVLVAAAVYGSDLALGVDPDSKDEKDLEKLRNAAMIALSVQIIAADFSERDGIDINGENPIDYVNKIVEVLNRRLKNDE